MSFDVPLSILSAIFAGVLIISAISSAVLFYHWKSYGMGNARVARGKALYASGLAVLLVATFATLVLLSLKP